MKKHQVVVLPDGLREWRKVRGLTQVRLAKAVGCSDTLIALIETGDRQPSLDNARKIAETLGIPLEAFAIVSAEDENGAAA